MKFARSAAAISFRKYKGVGIEKLWAFSALCMSSRGMIRAGGRKSSLGFSQTLGKSPQVKQGKAMGVVRRIPGTTKVEYINKKGRTFEFRVPATSLTHPPENLPSFKKGEWVNVDTSYCDTGEIETEMPTPIDDFLRKSLIKWEANEILESTGSESESIEQFSDGNFMELSLTQREIDNLGCLFLDFCKEYTLMDTRGMKSSSTYSELNSGPDYEHYDRKLKRKRYWLSICRNYRMVKEILWPSDVFALTDKSFDSILTLTPESMLETLVWLHASSTFCVRSWRSYDLVEKEAFVPLDLSREVRVLAYIVKLSGPNMFFQGLSGSERLITCMGFCEAYDVPLSEFFETSSAQKNSGHDFLWLLLLGLPHSLRCKESIRMIHALLGFIGSKVGSLCFSSENQVINQECFCGLSKLCLACVVNGSESLENVDEKELVGLLEFIVRIKEENKKFFLSKDLMVADASLLQETLDHRKTMERFAELCAARSRHLLYRLGGEQTTVLSGDNSYIPLIEFQNNKESCHRSQLHYRIGQQHAQGLRRVSLRSQSAMVLELLSRLQAANCEGDSLFNHSLSELTEDILQHISKLSSNGGNSLTLADVIRLLPILGRHFSSFTDKSYREKEEKRYERFFLHLSTAIGVEVQNDVSGREMALLVEGLACVGLVPSTYPQLEAVLNRMCLEGKMTLADVEASLRALFKLHKGHVSPTFLHAAAFCFQQHVQDKESPIFHNYGENSFEEKSARLSLLLSLLHALRYCKYTSLGGLVFQLIDAYPLENDVGKVVWTLSCRSTLGTLLAYLGAAVSEAEVRKKCFEIARLHLGEDFNILQAVEPDLAIDVLLSYAALDIPLPKSSLPFLASFSHLHTFTTELLAIHVLQCLENFEVNAEFLYNTYSNWLLKFLKSAKTNGKELKSIHGAKTVAMSICQLKNATKELKDFAITFLHEEVLLLEKERERLQTDSHSGVCSFEEAHLKRSSELHRLDKEVLQIISIIVSSNPTSSS